MAMEPTTKPIANPGIVLREEFDDWALLFDPDTGNTFTLDPVGVFIWKQLDGSRTVSDLHREIVSQYTEVPDTAATEIHDFLAELLKEGLAGIETPPTQR